MDEGFNFESFYSKVFNDYALLKMRKHTKDISSENFKNELKKDNFGCLILPFMVTFGKFASKITAKEINKQDGDVYLQEAKDLLAQPEIKKVICRSLRKASRNMVVTEEIFVRTVVETLADKDLRNQFVIPLEAMLFASIAFEVSETGFAVFCAGLHDEE